MSSTIITSYVDPDLDGVSCAFAYAEFLQKKSTPAVSQITGAPHLEAQWVLEQLQLSIPQLNLIGTEPIILVDTSNPHDIDQRIRVDHVIEIIDHRALHQADQFPHAKVQIELVGAAATLIAEKFFHEHIAPTSESATLLFGGIVSNTMNFKSSVTTDRDRAMAAWLKQQGHIPDDFAKRMIAAKSNLADRPLKGVIESDLPAPKKIGSTTVLVGQLEIVGAKHLYATRFEEIIQALVAIKKESHTDLIFLSTVDLEEGKNYLAYTNDEGKNLLIKILDAREEQNYLVREPLIIRKEIMPLLHQLFHQS